MNVLITSASRKVSLVSAFKRALELEGGGRVVAADAQTTSPALFVADRARVLPRSDSPRFWEALLAVLHEESIELVVPTRDEELPLFASRRAELEALGVTVPAPDPSAVALCQDKIAFAERCLAEGFSVPDRLGEDALARPSTFPVFARARRGKGGSSAFVIGSLGELEARRAEHGELLVQELVRAPELSLDVLCDLEGRPLSVVPRTRSVVVGGESFVSRTLRDPALVQLGARLAEVLGLRGHSVVQAFDRRSERDRIDLIEVNPRFGGASALAIAAGADSARLLVRMARGGRCEPFLGRYEAGVTMLRFTQDLFVGERALATLGAGGPL